MKIDKKIPAPYQRGSLSKSSSIGSERNSEVSSVKIKFNHLLEEIGFAGKKMLFVTDEKIWKNCARFFENDFGHSLILKAPKADEKNLNKILSAVKKQKFDLIIALGSGTINDLCKLTSAQEKIPYVIFASAPSMNGYLSRNASITINGHKKTVPATLPIDVFYDVKILKAAPVELIRAGLGDIMCFYSCWFDWYLSHLILETKFDEKPFKILVKKMEFLVKNYQKFSLKDEEFLEILIEILLLSGLGMTMAGGSYPASESEHLIAHTIEMKYPQKLENIFHGNQIAVTTLTSSRLQKEILGLSSLALKAESIKNLEKFFGKKVAAECKKEYQQKILSSDELAIINASLKKNWNNYRKKLSKIHFDENGLKKIFSHFKIKTSAKSLGLSSKQYQECVINAKFIRNRFTCLDLGV